MIWKHTVLPSIGEGQHSQLSPFCTLQSGFAWVTRRAGPRGGHSGREVVLTNSGVGWRRGSSKDSTRKRRPGVKN